MEEPLNSMVLDQDLAPAPKEYTTVLQHLRDIVAAKKWPETSVKRSSVIRRSGMKSSAACNGKAGSFTVVNPKLLDQLKLSDKNFESLPMANELFPELVTAVFALEEVISNHTRTVQEDGSGTVKVSNDNSTRRPQSSHCAINSMAQFTPHVDSGRGAGQSLSIIVGLGDYHKGELLVEGLPCNIRYQPLEFNGWTLRHWTNPYQGDRFSLVWFTPA